MNVFQILRATQRLNSPQLRGLQVIAWSCRIISGVFQGFGLLALVFEAVAVGVKVGAVLFGFAQVERAGAAGVDFGAGEVEGLCGVFAVGGVQRQLVVE